MYGGWHNAQYPSASAPLDASTWATTDPEMGTEIDDSLSAWCVVCIFRASRPPQMGPHASSSAAMPHTMGTVHGISCIRARLSHLGPSAHSFPRRFLICP